MSRRMEKLAKPHDGGMQRKTFRLGEDAPANPRWLDEYDELMVERQGRAKVPSRARPRRGRSPRKQAFLQRLESKGGEEEEEEEEDGEEEEGEREDEHYEDNVSSGRRVDFREDDEYDKDRGSLAASP